MVIGTAAGSTPDTGSGRVTAMGADPRPGAAEVAATPGPDDRPTVVLWLGSLRSDIARHQRGRAPAALVAPAWALLVGVLTDARRRVFLVALILSLALVPVALLQPHGPIYVGIATPSPSVYTYTIGVAVTAVVLAASAGRAFGGALLVWLPLLGWLAAVELLVWDSSPRTWSGLLQFGLGVVSFAIGVAARRRDPSGASLSWTFMVVAWVQVLAIGAAVLGLPLRRITGPQALDVLGRATGLTSHPGELAKVLFFCAVGTLALPQRHRYQRWAAWLTLGAILVGVSMSESRAVLAALLSMMLISVVLELAAGRWQRKHFVMIGLALVLGAVSLPWFIQRFMADPNGGARGHVTQVAERVIAQHPWTGVGPNGYVAVAGLTDRLTQTGVPVHNIFLLSAAELGIAGAVLLWLPFGLVAGRATYRVWRTRGTDPGARAVASMLPGIGLIALTGWGLLEGQGMLLLALVFGYFGARPPAAAGPDAGSVPGTTGAADRGAAPTPAAPATTPAGHTTDPAGHTADPASHTTDQAGHTADQAGHTTDQAGHTPGADGRD
jgi:O-Antigen ligase